MFVHSSLVTSTWDRLLTMARCKIHVLLEFEHCVLGSFNATMAAVYLEGMHQSKRKGTYTMMISWF